MIPKGEYQGIWWLPEKDDDKFTGTLKIDLDNKITLSIIGLLKGNLTEEEIPIMCGQIIGTKYIVLQHCNWIGSTYGSGLSGERFSARILFLGSEKISSIKFNKIRFSINVLTPWMADNTSKIYDKAECDGKKCKQLQLFDSDEIKIELAEAEITIYSYWNIIGKEYHNVYSCERQTLVEVSMSKMLALNELFDTFVLPFCRLLCFLTQQSAFVTDIMGINKGIGPDYWIDITYENIVRDQEYDERKILASFFYMNENFSDIIKNWFKLYSELKFIYIYFFALYNTYYLEEKFNNIVNVLEAYHRCRFDNVVQKQNVFDDRIETILSSAPSEERQWLKEKLKFANEPNLRKRLTELFEKISINIQPVIDGYMSGIIKDSNKKKTNSFIQLIVSTRNRMVHKDKENDERVLKNGEEMYFAVDILIIAFEIFTLRELKFSDKKIGEVMNQNLRYKQILLLKNKV